MEPFLASGQSTPKRPTQRGRGARADEPAGANITPGSITHGKAGLSRARSSPRRAASGSSGAAVRADAAQLVHAVRTEGRSLTDALVQLPSCPDPRDEALRAELAYGTLRLLPRLELIADQLLARPLKRADRIIGALLLIGLYQLIELRIPDHAAVSATVDAARILRRPRAAGLLNATLRGFQREREALLAHAEQQEGGRWLLPDWLLRRLRAAWPDDWPQIVAASNGRGPMFLRINPLKTSRSSYLQQLAAAQLDAEALPTLPTGLRLAGSVPTSALPGFDLGEVSVQDAGAQWAAELLSPQPGQRVLDACAAPGGKTAHLLEYAGGRLRLTAIDISPQRLAAISSHLQRLGLSARVLVGDATAPDARWANEPFDRILLDAPCSATGVIRRHPDIKWLRRDTDIAELAKTQQALLDALWPLLRPGGRMLYLTCSLLPEENERQIEAFLRRQADAIEAPLPAAVGRPRTQGRQLLPTDDGPDGFYFALLRKHGGAPGSNPDRADQG